MSDLQAWAPTYASSLFDKWIQRSPFDTAKTEMEDSKVESVCVRVRVKQRLLRVTLNYKHIGTWERVPPLRLARKDVNSRSKKPWFTSPCLRGNPQKSPTLSHGWGHVWVPCHSQLASKPPHTHTLINQWTPNPNKYRLFLTFDSVLVMTFTDFEALS